MGLLSGTTHEPIVYTSFACASMRARGDKREVSEGGREEKYMEIERIKTQRTPGNKRGRMENHFGLTGYH